MPRVSLFADRITLSLPAAWLLFLPALLLTSAHGQEKKGASPAGPPMGPPPALVVTEPAEAAEVTAGQAFVGTLQPRRRTIVGSAVDGRVLEFPIDDGQWVKKGDVLAQLLTEATEIELAHAEAERTMRAEELRELENGSLPEEKTQAQAQAEAAKAHLDHARAKHKRNQTIFQNGNAITQEDIDLSYATLVAAEQTYAAAEAAAQLMKKGPREERILRAKAVLAAQQELVNQLQDRLRKFTIKAPFDGYIVSEFTEAGAWVSRGDRIAELIEIDPMEILAAVPEAAIDRLQQAMFEAESLGKPLEALITVDAISGRAFTGQVAKIVPQADLRTRTFPVKIAIGNERQGSSHILKAGMMCHVTLPAGKKTQGVLVSKDALVLGGPSPIVFLAAGEPGALTAKPVPVTLGTAVAGKVQVIGDIKPGDLTIVRGNERVRPGQALVVPAPEAGK